MADEIELKLDLTPDAADRFEASGLLSGDPQIALQTSIYFDTPDRHLSKAGLSLRIRRSGETRVQTVKADGASAAGLFARSEWERPVESDTPILDDTTPVRLMIGDAVNTVEPLFEMKIERRIWTIEEGDTAIELVLDRGEVVAGDLRAPICEIELELKSGHQGALFAFARKIDAVAPVRLGVLSKAERGFALIGGAAAAVKAAPVGLASDATAAEAFRQIVQSCIRQFRLNEALLLTGRDRGALHQARVALRRLRSALSIFKPITGDDRVGERRKLRWLASELGDARDLDVLLDRAGTGPLRAPIAAAREAAYDRVGKVLALPRTRRLMLDLAEWTAGDDWLASPAGQRGDSLRAREFAVMALDRLRRRVKRKGRDLARIDEKARHEVRKDAKKLRYSAEFFAGLFERKREKRRHKRFIVALEALQDELGALNDLATAPDMLEKLGIANDPDAQSLLAGGQQEPLLKKAQDAYEDLIDTKPFWR